VLRLSALQRCKGLLDYFDSEDVWKAAKESKRFDVLMFILDKAIVVAPCLQNHTRSRFDRTGKYERRWYKSNVVADFGTWRIGFVCLARDAMDVAVHNQEPDQAMRVLDLYRRWKVPVLEDEHVKCFIQLNWEGVVEHIIENAMCNSVQFQRKNWVNALINAARYGRVNMVRMILVRRPNYVDVQYG